MAMDDRNSTDRLGTRDARIPDDAYSRRRSSWYIWVAVALLVAVALYVLVRGLGYASG
jgi:hypothetical protein